MGVLVLDKDRDNMGQGWQSLTGTSEYQAQIEYSGGTVPGVGTAVASLALLEDSVVPVL